MIFARPFRALCPACTLVAALGLLSCQNDSGTSPTQEPTVNRASPVIDAKGFRLIGQFVDPLDTVQFNSVKFVHLESRENRTVILMASHDVRLNRYRWILQPIDGSTRMPLQTKDEADPYGYQFRYDFASNTLFGYAKAHATRVNYFSESAPAPQFMQPPYAGAPLDLGARYSIFQDRTDRARLYVFDHQKAAYASPAPSSSTSFTPETSVVPVAAWITDQGADSASQFVKTAYLAYVTHSKDSGTVLKMAQDRKVIAQKQIFPDTTYTPEYTVVSIHATRTGNRIDLGLGWWGVAGFGLHLGLYRFEVGTNSLETVYDDVEAPSDTIDAFHEGTFHFGLKRVEPTGSLQEFEAPVLQTGATRKIVQTSKAVFLCVQKDLNFLEIYRKDLP